MCRILFVTIFIFLSGCSDSDKAELQNEIILLKTQLGQREEELKRYESIETEIEKLQKATQTVSTSSLEVLNKLEKLDEDYFGGKYVRNLRLKSPKPRTEDIVKGYMALIERIELEIEKR